ncbi:MAG TPA: hypothetical protein VJU53_09150 [Burkholderiaceae bacterium]|nr:hypothetical protein [Burkholderiaceae bacterium]
MGAKDRKSNRKFGSVQALLSLLSTQGEHMQKVEKQVELELQQEQVDGKSSGLCVLTPEEISLVGGGAYSDGAGGNG